MNFRSLKILTDENISPKVVAFLRKQGLDVLDTKEVSWHGREDDQLLEEANKQERFVPTHDSDFGTLAIHEGKRCFGIIYLKLRNLHPRNVTGVWQKLLHVDADFSEGALIIVEETRIRIRYPNSGEPYKDNRADKNDM